MCHTAVSLGPDTCSGDACRAIGATALVRTGGGGAVSFGHHVARVDPGKVAARPSTMCAGRPVPKIAAGCRRTIDGRHHVARIRPVEVTARPGGNHISLIPCKVAQVHITISREVRVIRAHANAPYSNPRAEPAIHNEHQVQEIHTSITVEVRGSQAQRIETEH